ncbi:MAG: hypothetical protein Q8R63_04065 [Ramlibacter sp.]|nr:hypothetical protein [Ramlibacter sp.]
MSPQELGTATLGSRARRGSAGWQLSWPLLAGLTAYLYALGVGQGMLIDGDTYWHVATGRWMFDHRVIPSVDPFSHSMAGAAWTAHEWLSEIILAGAHQLGGWTLVVGVTSAAFAVTHAILMRALLRWLEPVYALLFTVLAVVMTVEHLLARPHIIALPLLVVWTVELVRASEERRTPAWWMWPLMTLWANLHGGFTFGLVLVCVMALEAVVLSPPTQRASTARAWAIWFALALGASLVTPHGINGLLFTWHVLFNLGPVLASIGEWRSPDFHTFNALELWLLAGLALVLHQGLRLPPLRLIVVLGLLHMALKHARYIEMVGLLAPLFVAGPFAQQWHRASEGRAQLERVDRFFDRLSVPAGASAILATLVLAIGATFWVNRSRPMEPPASIPVQAVAEALKAGVAGPVLNSYGLGGYLIYMGIPVYIDGRADMYGARFAEEYIEAMSLQTAEAFDKLLEKYRIAWTLLMPHSPAAALLDRTPGWKRLYTDKAAVVHVRVDGAGGVRPAPQSTASADTAARRP